MVNHILYIAHWWDSKPRPVLASVLFMYYTVSGNPKKCVKAKAPVTLAIFLINFLDQATWSRNFLNQELNKGVKLATQLSFNSFVQVWSILPSWSRKLINFPIVILLSARATSLLIAWSSRLKLSEQWILFQLSWSSSHTFPTHSHYHSVPTKLNENLTIITKSITVETQANCAWRKQLDSSATSWTCNFQLDSRNLNRSPFSWSTFIYWTFNFQFLDQVAWSRKLIKKIASVTGA